MSVGQSDEALHLPSEKRIACDEECADLLLSKCRKGPVEIILAGNVQNGNSTALGLARPPVRSSLGIRPADFSG